MNNPELKRFFHKLTHRALIQSSLPDVNIEVYLTDLLLNFVSIEKFLTMPEENGRKYQYLLDMIQAAGIAARQEKKACYQYIGDRTLFTLGMFPESLDYGRRSNFQSYYSDLDRRSYLTASELDRNYQNVAVFRKLAEKFERCVLSINWFREYTYDPFYQSMFRQFGIT